MNAYNTDPRLDVHTYVQDQIEAITGRKLERRAVKILNFGMLYGMGLGKLAEGMGTTVEDAKLIKNAQLRAIPGLKGLTQEINARGRSGDFIATQGGRRYYTEPPLVLPNGHVQTFEYKLLNYLIQGSAADCTKQAIINYDQVKKHGRLLCTVHDEINLSVPTKAVKSEMKLLGCVDTISGMC